MNLTAKKRKAFLIDTRCFYIFFFVDPRLTKESLYQILCMKKIKRRICSDNKGSPFLHVGKS